jgi:hypothetical protein
MNDIFNNACKFNNVEILEWLKKSKWIFRDCMILDGINTACKYGNIDILKWFGYSRDKFEINILLNICKSVHMHICDWIFQNDKNQILSKINYLISILCNRDKINISFLNWLNNKKISFEKNFVLIKMSEYEKSEIVKWLIENFKFNVQFITKSIIIALRHNKFMTVKSILSNNNIAQNYIKKIFKNSLFLTVFKNTDIKYKKYFKCIKFKIKNKFLKGHLKN